MKTSIFFILICFAHMISCNSSCNITENGSFPLCPVKFFRRKRALSEYTRWRVNLETSPEFILKILDDDLITPKTKKIVAVNIQPATKAEEKIIIGGAMVSPPVSFTTTKDPIKDYTRFVPPTTLVVTNIEGEYILNPASIPIGVDMISPIPPPKRLTQDNQGAGKHSLRDESPPASPQFLARTPLVIARQYAPITPVSFTRRTTIAPLTPPSADSNTLRNLPSRSTALMEIDPTRTVPHTFEFRNFEQFDDDEINTKYEVFLTRTSFEQQLVPRRTTDPERTIETNFVTRTTHEPDIFSSIAQNYGRNFDNDIKVIDKDSESSYNMMFYVDEDSERSKKSGQESTESYDDKNVARENIVPEKEHKDENDTIIKPENITTPESYLYRDNNEEDLLENVTNFTITIEKIKDDQTNVETKTNKSIKTKIRDSRRQMCSLLKLRQLNFNSARTLPEIIAQLKKWSDESPMAKWVDITSGNLTTMENPIYMMIIDDPRSGQIISAKKTVMVVAGIQGRDHHAVAAAMYVLYQLIERSDSHTDLLSKFRFWVIPVFNPDGYDYSMTFPHRREWTKNLRQTWESCTGRDSCASCATYGIRCTIQPCYGVNLDRNFEYQWIPTDELRAEHPCGPLYAGGRQLSEPETRALTSYLHEQRIPLFTFIAFKEGEVLGVMYPYSHTKKRRTFDHVYRQRASRAASAAFRINGRPYVAGQTSEFLPLYAGGIEDWVDGHQGIDNTYTIMLYRPTESLSNKLVIERVVHEAYAALGTLLLQSVELPSAPPVILMKARASNTSASFLITSLLLTMILLSS